MIKKLKIQIATESNEEKFKRFNNFIEYNVIGMIYPDGNDTPIKLFLAKKNGIKPNAAIDVAMGHAYVDLLSQYIDNPSMKDMSDEQLRKIYLKLYNKNLFETHKSLKEKLAKARTPREEKEILAKERQEVMVRINSIKSDRNQMHKNNQC